MRTNNRTSIFYFSLFCCVLILLITFGCQKKADAPTIRSAAQKQGPSPITFHPYFNKTVGSPIDSATANRWKRNLQDSLSKYRSVIPAVYYLPASVFRNLVEAPNAVGLMFYYGKDEQGRLQLELMGVDHQGRVMPATTVYTTQSVISWQLAKTWRDRFRQQDQKGIQGHFWGSNAVQRLLAEGTQVVRISRGLNDEGSPTLLFSNAAVDLPDSEEDNLRTCPPYCP